MTKLTETQATAQAKKFSDKYNTFWYVRKLAEDNYQPWAQSSEDDRTVAGFYCGRKLVEVF